MYPVQFTCINFINVFFFCFVLFLFHRWVVDVYGRVYLKAWRLAEGPYLTLLEERCIQDLMFSAIHAPRVRPNELFQVFRRVSELREGCFACVKEKKNFC